MKTLSDLLNEKGLWANIHAKRARGEKMRKPGEKGAPTDQALKDSQTKNEDSDPCWDSHEMIGMKKKNGKKVPNCVPKNEETVQEGVDKDHQKILDRAKTSTPKKPKSDYESKVVSYLKKKYKKEEAEQFCQACTQTPCVCGGNHVEEGFYKAELEGLPPTFMSGDSVSDVRARLRNLVKKPGEQIKDIQRVQPSQMKKYFRDISTGKEEMEEAYIAEAEMPDQTMDLSYLEESLADAYMMQFMAHSFHWNVKGQDFIQYHNFLEELYTEILEEVDGIAEQIRISGKAAPVSLISLIEMSNIDEQETVVTTPQQMMTALEDANDEVILSLYGALDIATEANAQGLINFLADRIDAHAKIGWKLSSSQE